MPVDIEVTTRVIEDKFMAVEVTINGVLSNCHLIDIQKWIARERALEAVSDFIDIVEHRQALVEHEKAMAGKWSRDGEVL